MYAVSVCQTRQGCKWFTDAVTVSTRPPKDHASQNPSVDGGREDEGPPLTEEILARDGCWLSTAEPTLQAAGPTLLLNLRPITANWWCWAGRTASFSMHFNLIL